MPEDDLVSQEKSGYKSNLVMIIIIVLVALVMGGGGFFIGKKLGSKADGSKEIKKQEDVKDDVEEEKKEESIGAQKTKETSKTEGKAGKKDDENSKNVSSSDFLKEPGTLVLDEFTVNLTDPFGRRYGNFLIKLEFEKQSYINKVKENELLMSKIRHEVNMILSSKSFRELNTPAGKQMLGEEIMMRVNEKINELLNIEPVIDVFFDKILMQ